MNKTQFIEAYASANEMTKAQAKEEVGRFLDTLLDIVEAEGEVNLTGFGKFEVKEVEEQERRNPATGDLLVVEAHNKLTFKFAKPVKERFK